MQISPDRLEFSHQPEITNSLHSDLPRFAVLTLSMEIILRRS